MKPIFLFCCTISISLLQAAAQADAGKSAPGGERLTLDGADRAALANNPAIKEALKKWEAMKSRIPQEAAWDDPRVSASSRVARYVNVSPNAFADQMGSVEQMIPLSGKNLSRARIAAADALSAFEAARRVQLDTLAKTRAAYFQLANACAQIALNDKSLKSLKHASDNLTAKYETGGATAADVLAAETETDKLLEARRDLEKSLAQAQSQLNVLMGRDAFSPLGAPEETADAQGDLAVARLRALILSNRPEVKMAVANVALEKARLQLAHRLWIPDPAFTVQAQRYNDAVQAVSEVDAGISFSLPWANPGKYSAGVREANDDLEAAQQGLESAQNEAIGLLRNALQNVETAHHHLQLFRDKLLPRARQSLDVIQSNYESGKAGFAEWVAAQHNLQELEAMERQHLADYQTALAELEAAVGTDLHFFPAIPAQERQSK